MTRTSFDMCAANLRASDFAPGTKAALYLSSLPSQGPVQGEASSGSGPLFSLIVRSDGARPELLREALYSVYAQEEERYEVLLCAHEHAGAPAATAAVERLLKTLPPDLTSRVRLLPVAGGGRSKPLNEAIEAAEGRFICMLDDDDLLLDNHFSTVARAMEENPESLGFHTFGARRWIHVHGGMLDPAATYPYSTMRTELFFTIPFSAFRQQAANYIPICNYFVSTAAARAFGLRFDERLEILEDWKFLMDASRLFEIVPVPVITTVVNLRDNASNTITDPNRRSLHEKSLRAVQEHLASEPRVFTPRELQGAATLHLNYERLLDFKRSQEGRISPFSSLRSFSAWLWRKLPLTWRQAIKRGLRQRVRFQYRP